MTFLSNSCFLIVLYCFCLQFLLFVARSRPRQARFKRVLFFVTVPNVVVGFSSIGANGDLHDIPIHGAAQVLVVIGNPAVLGELGRPQFSRCLFFLFFVPVVLGDTWLDDVNVAVVPELADGRPSRTRAPLRQQVNGNAKEHGEKRKNPSHAPMEDFES